MDEYTHTVKDIRSGKLLANEYTVMGARKLAHDLNLMVLQNTGGITPARVQQIKGGSAPVVTLTRWATWHREGDRVIFSGPFVVHAL